MVTWTCHSIRVSQEGRKVTILDGVGGAWVENELEDKCQRVCMGENKPGGQGGRVLVCRKALDAMRSFALAQAGSLHGTEVPPGPALTESASHTGV